MVQGYLLQPTTSTSSSNCRHLQILVLPALLHPPPFAPAVDTPPTPNKTSPPRAQSEQNTQKKKKTGGTAWGTSRTVLQDDHFLAFTRFGFQLVELCHDFLVGPCGSSTNKSQGARFVTARSISRPQSMLKITLPPRCIHFGLTFLDLLGAFLTECGDKLLHLGTMACRFSPSKEACEKQKGTNCAN